ncbi:MAG TPA: MBL fold metallo-hydrolase [Candidatus Saccharimonadales bacterium]|nr:MBL fold metallo-hydrolase [Candidatus Saccharimonadales bacterium]
MDMQFYGANCIVIGSKQGRIVIDDNLADLGGKSVAKEGDITLYTMAHGLPSATPRLLIDQPGEYEVFGISVYGIAARAHMDEQGKKTATMYKIMTEDLSILVIGHVYPELNDTQLEKIGMVDIMFVPVGGNGYTLDGIGALKLVKKIEPKLVVPTHYDDSRLHFEVPQQTLEQGVKALAMEPKETVAKLRVKPAELADANTQLVVLEHA